MIAFQNRHHPRYWCVNNATFFAKSRQHVQHTVTQLIMNLNLRLQTHETMLFAENNSHCKPIDRLGKLPTHQEILGVLDWVVIEHWFWSEFYVF